MGKIDKEKLLKRVEALKYDSRGYVTIFDIIKNFPEEPAQQIQKPREIPVKTIYTLKKEYQDVFKDFSFLHSTFDTHSYEPLPENIKKYYDRTDELDYSAIPNGSLVEFKCKNNNSIHADWVTHHTNEVIHCLNGVYSTKLYNIRVVEWGKDAVP